LFVCNSFAQFLTNPLAGFPPSKPYTAGTIYPCGFNITDIVFAAPVNVMAGQYVISVTWVVQSGSNLNPNNNDEIALDLFTYPVNGTTQFYENVMNYTWGNSPEDLRIPLNTIPGVYLLRFMYANYYSCSAVNISSPPYQIEQRAPGESIVALPDPGVWRYYEIDNFPANNELILSIVGPVNPYTRVVIASNLQPNQLANDYYSEELNTGSVTSTTNSASLRTGVCADDYEQDPTTYTVGIYSDPSAVANDTGSAITLTFGVYSDSRIGVADTQRIVQAHDGPMYFWTTAYSSELDGYIRIVIDVYDGGALPAEFYGAENCAGTQQRFSVDSTMSYGTTQTCLDVSKRQATKYIRVSPMSTSYSIKTERGTCSELTSGSTQIFLSALLLVLALLFTF